MLEHLIAAILGSACFGAISWHVAHLLARGSLFEPLRDWLQYRCSHWETGCGSHWCGALRIWWEGFHCRLCLSTQVAIVITWGALTTGLLVRPSELPAPEWGFIFAVGPFLVAAWAEAFRRIEIFEPPLD